MRDYPEFPITSLEKDLYGIAVDVGFEDGEAKVVSRSLHRAITEMGWGLSIPEEKAMGYLKRVLNTPDVSIMCLPTLNL